MEVSSKENFRMAWSEATPVEKYSIIIDGSERIIERINTPV